MRRYAAVWSARRIVGAARRPFSTVKAFEEIPGPPSIPEQGGSAQDFVGRLATHGPYGFVDSYYNEFGPLVRLDMAGSREVLLFEMKEAARVFRNEGKYPIGAASLLWPLNVYNKEFSSRPASSLSLVGEQWRKMRFALQKDLSKRSAAESYLPKFYDPIENAMKCLPHAPTFMDVAPYCAMDMFMSAMLGIDPQSVFLFSDEALSAEQRKYVEFAKVSISALDGLGQLMLDPRIRDDTESELFQAFRRDMDSVFTHSEAMIKMVIERGMDGGDAPPYFHRLLSRNEVQLDEAISELTGFLFAGVDTTAHTLQWFVLNLAKHPEVQDRVREEVLSVVGQSGRLEPHHIPQLSYMDKAMRESHRLNPVSFIMTFRQLDKDIDLCGYNVPAGTRIA
eukprot:Hpha_TRINITY_DN16035_c0_g2::TRINITY_DN16035_c0_g2_i2::g.120351::m.120351